MNLYMGAEGVLMVGLILGLIPLRTQYTRTHFSLLCLQSFCVTAAYGVFVMAHIYSEFSLLHVAQTISPHQTLFYRIVASWSDHAGSFFLWLTLYVIVLNVLITRQPDIFQTSFVLRSRLCISLFIVYMFVAAHPLQLSPAAHTGLLNPLLKDWSLGFHPPILYLGQVGLLLSSAALLQQQVASLRNTFLLSWTLLTLGITWGSFWAYYELGWGGWWFWDPVENVALLPWLLGTMIIHDFRNLTGPAPWRLQLMIIILCFGVWFVRGGMVSSVHSFAYDTHNSLKTLVCFALIAIVSIPHIRTSITRTSQTWFKRQQVLISIPASIIALTLISSCIYKGLYGMDLNFHPEFFHTAVCPFLMLTLGYLGYHYRNQSYLPLIFAFAVSVFMIQSFTHLWLCLCISIAVGVAGYLILSMKYNRLSKPAFCAHMGMCLIALSIGLNGMFASDKTLTLKPHEEFHFAKGRGHIIEHTVMPGPDFNQDILRLSYKPAWGPSVVLQSDQHQYIRVEMHKPVVGLKLTPMGLFFVTHQTQPAGAFQVYLRHDPFVMGIWLGGLLIVLGGLGSILGRFRRKQAPCPHK